MTLRALTEEEVDTISPLMMKIGTQVELLSFTADPRNVWLALVGVLHSFETHHGFDPNDILLLPDGVSNKPWKDA